MRKKRCGWQLSPEEIKAFQELGYLKGQNNHRKKKYNKKNA